MSRVFQIFRERGGPFHAVNDGPAWLAVPVPFLWAFAHRLWGRALLLLFIDLVLGLLAPGLLRQEPVALAIALLVPRLVALFRGAGWLAFSHEDRGRESLGRIVARSRVDAIAQVARRDGVIPEELRPRRGVTGFAFPPPSLQQITAVARLTVRAAFRYRLVMVLIVVLLGAVVVLPMIIKHDETARGFTQILLTYTLGVITALLSMVTLWLACGTLARDVDDSHMQVVAVKPIPRWQIWLGKWIGIMALDGMLLGISAGAVFLLMSWRATLLPPELQEALRSNVLTSRAVAREPAPDLETRVNDLMEKRRAELESKGIDLQEFRAQAREVLKAQSQIVVPPDHYRRFHVDLRHAESVVTNRSVFLQLKFNTPDLSPKRPYELEIQAGPPDTHLRRHGLRALAAEASHEIEVGTVFLDAEGRLVVDIANRSGVPLIFPLEDGFSVLYHEGGFGVNYVRAAIVIACWLGLLAAIGLAAASFLSFPVAAFLATTVLILGMSTGTLKSVVEDRTVLGFEHDSNKPNYPLVDAVMVPVFKVVLDTVTLVQQFSPIDAVSSGRAITWGTVARAVFLVVGIVGGAFAALGITAFTRRELATAQSNH